MADILQSNPPPQSNRWKRQQLQQQKEHKQEQQQRRRLRLRQRRLQQNETESRNRLTVKEEEQCTRIGRGKLHGHRMSTFAAYHMYANYQFYGKETYMKYPQ